ncbi:MAG: patatin-like phospholipase family protein [Deltaproteobacteria bacterium]|nr:patatin-like phospholipase family protein [Deltaproteobacteria bacterium]
MSRHDRALILSGGGARGAYEIGVWKHLCEMKWRPDLICGTSVGSINGAAIVAGLSVDDLVMLWKSLDRDKIFRVPILRRIMNFIRRRGFTAYMDTRPLRAFLDSQLDVNAIRTSDIELVISAVNVLSSEIAYFDNNSIGIDHIMASSAIPMLFPWQYVGGEPYWDAAVMVNTPIAPAMERQAREIVVVLLSPVGGVDLPLPTSQHEALERLFEHALIGSYEAFRSHISREQEKRTRIASVSPGKMLGFQSMLNFSSKQSDELIDAGYEDAKAQLAEFFSSA